MDQVTVDTYNALAREYDEETSEFWDLFPRTVIEKFASLATGSVLDVGSGPGRDGLLLQQKGLKVTCLDASESMIALSKAKGLDSIQGDLLALPFPDASFDGVWAYTSLLHIKKADIPKALSEIRRVLKPSGVFGLGLIEGADELYRESSGMKSPRWFAYYTRPELESYLEAHGFSIEYFEQFKPGSKNYLNYVCRKT